MGPVLGGQGPGQQLAQPQVVAVHHGEAPAQRVVAGEPLLGVEEVATILIIY